MQNWDDVIAVSFVETSAYDGDINFGNLTNSPNTQAIRAFRRLVLRPRSADRSPELPATCGVSTAQISNFQFDEANMALTRWSMKSGTAWACRIRAPITSPRFAVTYANGAEYAQDARNYRSCPTGTRVTWV